MHRTAGDWWVSEGAVTVGARYGFLLDDDPAVLPDPRSPRQPDGVHEPSQRWRPAAPAPWQGRELRGSIVYELHVGTFTAGGTFDSAIERLDHLVELGVGFVQLMPVNAFNGPHGWGYDGVGWFAVHEPYGGPDGLQRFVDAAHSRSLGVLLDVVYNHLGPSGNYLDSFGPYETDAAITWGKAINVAGPGSDQVRRYILDNALRWLRDFGIDGLRLDAVHALADTTAVHLLEELSIEVDALSKKLGRPLTLIAESDLNDPRLITPRERGGHGLSAQWNDDVHHAVHTLVSGERQGYYGDFGSPECLATVLTEGFFHAGTYSSFRGRRHGRPIDRSYIDGARLLAYTCTHDQVGNRATGDRPAEYLDDGQLAIKAALVLFSAFTPMLFMGEEWGARTPFRFFTSHPEPKLAAATASGRIAEFAAHGWPETEIPDPQHPGTFAASRLDWSEPGTVRGSRLLKLYRDLISLRADPALSDPDLRRVTVGHGGDGSWVTVTRGDLTLAVNLTAGALTVPVTGTEVLAWAPSAAGDEGTTVPAHSFVVLRQDAAGLSH
jgi:maltooligosyltrehalose trehalohydrolase